MMTPFAKSYKVLDGMIGNIGNVYKVFYGLLFMKNLKIVFFFDIIERHKCKKNWNIDCE